MAAVLPKDYFCCAITSRVDLNILHAIKQKLSSKNMSKLNKSCFGNFVKLVGRIQFQGQLYLHLLFKQDKNILDDKLVFHMNKREVVFGPLEFALITGLKFGTKPDIPDSCIFIHEVWGESKHEFYIQDIEDAFMQVEDNGDTDLSLKLALLWVLYSVLLPREKIAKITNTEYIRLVDNLNDFNNYPWGCVCYELLLNDTRKIMSFDWFPGKNKRRVKQHHGHRQQLVLYGFIYALQIWSYETIPFVAKMCAKKVSEDVIPRMLRWEVDRRFNFTHMTEMFFPKMNRKDEVQSKLMITLAPSSREKQTPHYKSLVAWEGMNALPSSSKAHKRKKTLPFNEYIIPEKIASDNVNFTNEEIHKQQTEEQMKKVPFYGKTNPDLKTTESLKSEENVLMNEMLGDINKLKRNHKRIDLKLDLIIHNQRIIMAKMGCFEDVEEVKQLQFGVHESASDGMNSDLDEIDAFSFSEDEEVCLDANKDVDSQCYDPISTTVPEGVEDVFLRWFSNKYSPPVHVSVGDYPEANIQWFRRIWDECGWLCSENIDTLMYLVLYKAKRWPSYFCHGWAVVDLGFWGHVTGHIYKKWYSIPKKSRKEWDWNRQETFVKQYVLGTYPLNDNNLPWREAKKVFGVAHVNQNHWVLYELCLEEQVITVYDSLSGGGRRPNPKHMLEFRKLAMMMPSIYKGFIKNEVCTGDENGWEVKLYPDTPQQKDMDSCGVFCIKILECLACGRSVKDIDPNMIAKYRKKYCYELFGEDYIQFPV